MRVVWAVKAAGAVIEVASSTAIGITSSWGVIGVGVGVYTGAGAAYTGMEG